LAGRVGRRLAHRRRSIQARVQCIPPDAPVGVSECTRSREPVFWKAPLDVCVARVNLRPPSDFLADEIGAFEYDIILCLPCTYRIGKRGISYIAFIYVVQLRRAGEGSTSYT
jgi:hypothetical protein